MPVVHRTQALQALLPRYVTRFQCIGPRCEDSCCHGWHVPLDKETYKAYRQNARLAPAVAIRPEPRTDNAWGMVVFKDRAAACPMLDGDLCSVHKTFGEAALSHTCFTYPRQWSIVAGQCQESLELSCPEAARLALLAPDAFEFAEGPVRVRMDVVSKVTSHGGVEPELLNEVRIFCMNLVRVEGLALWQRLAVLGLFCESLDEPFARRDNAAVRALLASFVALLEQGEVLDALAAMQADHAAQAMLFSTLWGGQELVTPNPARNEVINAVSRGLGADPQTGQVSGERLVACYQEGLARLPAALQAAPHLLDHYVLNEMFASLFPFATARPFDSYLRLVARFGLLRLMLAARCNSGGALPDAQALVRTVQVHCRRFHHDLPFVTRVDAALAKHGWARLDRLYGLLRA